MLHSVTYNDAGNGMGEIDGEERKNEPEGEVGIARGGAALVEK